MIYKNAILQIFGFSVLKMRYYRFWNQCRDNDFDFCAGTPKHYTTLPKGVWMVRQHCRTSLDQGKWPVQTVCRALRCQDTITQEIEWRYVPTDENPADLASRGAPVKSALWQQGPAWLQDKSKWPINPVTRSSPASEMEAKVIREVLNQAQTKPEQDEFDELLEHNSRVGAWIKRFLHNCKHKEKKLGPLLTEEIEEVRGWWIKRVQRRDRETTGYPQISGQLNLQPNEEGVMTCHGRIQGQTPIYLPNSASFTGKLVQQVHCTTLHGGVALTMAAVRERYWIPKLRSLVKSVRSKCYGCKRFNATPARNPIPGQLPEDRTTVGAAFEVIGTDFA